MTSGASVLLAIRLFQYCQPNVNWLTRVGENCEFKCEVGDLQVVGGEVAFRQVTCVAVAWSFEAVIRLRTIADVGRVMLLIV